MSCNNSLHPSCKQSFHNQQSAACAAENERSSGICSSLPENVTINPCSRYLNAYGESRVAAAPGAPAQKIFARARRPQVQAVTTGPPCAMVYDLYRALPGEPAFATVASRAPLEPSRNLTPAWARQDHTTSPSVPCRSSHGTSPSTANPLHVRDDAYAPCVEAGCSELIMISENRKEDYFCRRDWTGQIGLRRQAKFVFSRRPPGSR